MTVSAIFFCVPTICMVGAPTGHYLFLFCNCQKLPTEPNHAYFYRLAGLAPLALKQARSPFQNVWFFIG
jgi:hypothetical protein